MFLFGLLLIFGGVALFASKVPGQQAGNAKKGGSLAAAIGILLAVSSGVVVIEAGSVGVVRVFGKVSDEPLREGLHIINPLASIDTVSIRTEEYTMTRTASGTGLSEDDAILALSKDGLPLPIDVTINYRPNPTLVPWLYRTIGTSEDFVVKIIRPASRAAVRDAVSTYTAQEAYSSKREQVVISITKGLEQYVNDILEKTDNFKPGAFIIQQVLVRNIELPQKLKDSIEAKLTAEQEALRMEYVLQKERQEAARLRIEAQGISDYQKIVNAGLTDKLLAFKGIEATEKLAASPNAKVVVVGGGKSGLPLILNTDSLSVAPAKP